MDSFIGNGEKKLQLGSDAIEKFMHEITALKSRLPALKTFDYTRQFNTMREQQQPDEVEILRRREIDRKAHEHSMTIKELQAKLCKLDKIKKFPELLKMDDINRLATMSLVEVSNFKIFNRMPLFINQILSFCSQLQGMKKDILDRSQDIILPVLDADFEAFIANHYLVNEYAQAKPKTQPDHENVNALCIWVYFNSLLSVLKILNKMVNVKNTSKDEEVIGIEVESAECLAHVFPDTKPLPVIMKYPLTQLNFIIN